ncbi:cytochrome b5 [Aphelenchoides avenae]|nr:cytochrome b5 [Aphelenchus avenae]
MDLQTVLNLPEYSRKEVQQQAGENWIIINDLVYDLTEFLSLHPGGAEVLYEYVGLDATTVFQDVGHSASAQRHMVRYVIGRVVESECTYRDRSEFACQASAALCAMKASPLENAPDAVHPRSGGHILSSSQLLQLLQQLHFLRSHILIATASGHPFT